MSSLMERAHSLVTFLGNVLPSNYEIVLQDVEAGKIIAIEHSEVSGRHKDAPLTDYALKVIADERWKSADYELNYSGLTKDNKILRSSTFFLKENGVLLGMICINANTTVYEDLSRAILKLGGLFTESQEMPVVATTSELPIENFSRSYTDIIGSTISSILETKGNIHVSRLTQEEKLEIVCELNNQGIFLIKGAISEVAEKLGCSDASIYRYLSKLNKQKQQ